MRPPCRLHFRVEPIHLLVFGLGPKDAPFKPIAARYVVVESRLK